MRASRDPVAAITFARGVKECGGEMPRTTDRIRGGARLGRRMVCARWVLPLVLGLAIATPSIGCGFGTYDDTGSAEPGAVWPWICPDGGSPNDDAGCLPDPCGEGSEASLSSCGVDAASEGAR